MRANATHQFRPSLRSRVPHAWHLDRRPSALSPCNMPVLQIPLPHWAWRDCDAGSRMSLLQADQALLVRQARSGDVSTSPVSRGKVDTVRPIVSVLVAGMSLGGDAERPLRNERFRLAKQGR